jgi:hypothetical protein
MFISMTGNIRLDFSGYTYGRGKTIIQKGARICSSNTNEKHTCRAGYGFF